MNPRRPHFYQIHDSLFHVRQSCGRWVVVETWTELDRYGQKDDMDREHFWADTEAEARAWMEANTP